MAFVKTPDGASIELIQSPGSLEPAARPITIRLPYSVTQTSYNLPYDTRVKLSDKRKASSPRAAWRRRRGAHGLLGQRWTEDAARWAEEAAF